MENPNTRYILLVDDDQELRDVLRLALDQATPPTTPLVNEKWVPGGSLNLRYVVFD